MDPEDVEESIKYDARMNSIEWSKVNSNYVFGIDKKVIWHTNQVFQKMFNFYLFKWKLIHYCFTFL
jgi:hypothetical protein